MSEQSISQEEKEKIDEQQNSKPDVVLEEKTEQKVEQQVEQQVDTQVQEEAEAQIQTELNKPPDEILLRLGDVILVVDPTNEILNNNVFLIEYIDPKKIKLVNADTFERTTLQISPSGVIGDGNIQSIKVISSNPESGYARQNDLLPGTWINIYFGGEIPTVITGEITNIEEDMIEIKTTDGDTLFINFDYQGIPEDLPIETFEIRPPIKDKADELQADELVELGEEEEDQNQGIIKETITKKDVREKIQRLIFNVEDLQLGDIVRVEEYVNIDREKYRYNIETQTNDLLEEMVSDIPNAKRTNNVLNSIHIMITRFLQLRKIASTFDENKNIDGIIKKSSNDRPLAEYLSEFKNTLYWIMMVSKNVKKIYPNDAKVGYKRYSDYETLDDNETLLELSSLYTNKDYQKDNRGQSRHSSFTYKSFDKYMTPFFSLNPDTTNDVFTKTDGIIIEGNVESDINAIVDNLDDFYSTVVSRSQITNRRFVIQRYNLGLEKLHASNFKGQHMIAHRVKLTENDPISIQSIVTLPESAVRFSQINLPGSNLLVKANLNIHFLNYWQLLKQKTDITKITIDGLDNELEYDDNNFINNIKQYMLDLTEYEKPKDLTNLDIYKIFLRTIIPKIRILFGLVKKYIVGRLSMIDVISYLEPFLIYPIDLTYMQYRDINRFIYEKIKEYNRLFKENSVAFSSIKYIKTVNDYTKKENKYVFSNPLYGLIGDSNKVEELDLQRKVFETYGYENPKAMNISGSEFLKKTIVADYGNLYNTATALTNIQLMFPSDLSSVFDKDKDKIASIMERDKKDDQCNSYIVAKKYYSLDELTQDNNKVIYFDKEFDTTNYDLVNEEYKKEKDKLTSEELIVFLTDKLKKKQKLNEQDAEYYAETLVNQAKKVKEGNYALLVLSENGIPDMLEYYVRKDDIWVLEKDVDPNSFIKGDDVLCNINYNCVYEPKEKGDDKCISTEVSKDSIIGNALKNILDQFDKNYKISKEELNSRIHKHLDYYTTIFEKIQKIKRTQFLKYNDIQYNLGLSVLEEMKEQVVSPYVKLRDLIMGQNDFVKKQTDIVRFVSLYCRDGNPEMPNINDGAMEDEWWLYCVKTNTKLLPKFVYILADTFVTKNSQYDDVLSELKRQIGKRSDNGDAWVDEHSGEVICYIDQDVSEGYTDGFANKSREIMEKDAGETILEDIKDKKDKKNRRLSAEGELVSNVISTLSTNMGIDIEQSRDFIIKIVTELMNDRRIVEKESSYKKREEEAAKKGKKLPSYSKFYGSNMIFLTLGMYLIALQTSIPSIKTRKTAPGCVRSFSGFPFEGEGDDSGLKYVVCVALKSKEPSTIPWNGLDKLKEENAISTLKSFIVRYLMIVPEVEQKIKEKTTYLLTNPNEDIPEIYDLGKWTNFLPPLKRFNVKHLDNITDGFNQELRNDLLTGNYHQMEKMLVVDSKIISYSLAIQEAIQKLVEKKKLLLHSAGQLFMDNACCNEKGQEQKTVLQYFADEDKNIEIYNNVVSSLSGLVRDIKILTQSAIMLSEVDTKRVYPLLSNDYSEETIYYAFITLCKFQSAVPLSEELVSVCMDKPDYLGKMDTIQEKIEKLKRDGRNYTKEQFLRLFQIVSRNNLIKMALSKETPKSIDRLNKVLEILNGENSDYVPKVLIQHLEKVSELHDVALEEDNKTIRDLRNHLQKSIDIMRKDLISFIKGKVVSLELTNITLFLNNISKWRFDEKQRNSAIKISDDSMYNYIQYFKNFIALLSIVFPSMIINEQIQTIDPPKYWGLSRAHSDDVKSMVADFYEPIEGFYGNKTLKNVLASILSKSRGIYLLSISTPLLTNIQLGEAVLRFAFDKRTVSLLYEYYLFSIFSDYIDVAKDPSIVSRMLPDPDDDGSDLFSSDFLVDQQLKLVESATETEQQIMGSNVLTMKTDVARLLVAYLNIMMRSKKTIDVSYQDIRDQIFKLKEAEKYDFTDRLKDMTEDQRAVDTILKHNKLGSLYSIGLSKGIKQYDPDNFDHDKMVAERVAALEKKGLDVDDALEAEMANQEIDMDNAMVDVPEWELNAGDDEDPFDENDRDYD